MLVRIGERFMVRLEDDLAASFRQGDHLAKYDPALPANGILFSGQTGRLPELGGVCFALSAMWVVRHAHHRAEGPAGRAAYLARESSIRRAWDIHRRAAGIGCRNNDATAPAPQAFHAWEHCSNWALEPLGLTARATALGRISRSGQTFAAEVATLHANLAGAHRYHLITICGSSPTRTHAVASYMAGGAKGTAQLHLFDPNWGEFKLNIRHFTTFMPGLLGWYDAHGEFGRISELRVDSVAQRG